MTVSKWDKRFLVLAEHKASWSLDKGTKVGCVIAKGRQDKYYGYNGFPQGIADTDARLHNYDLKHKLVIHAEMNAIFSARESLEGHTLYSTLVPCIRCAVSIIRVGITRVVCYSGETIKMKKHAVDIELTKQIFNEAGIEFIMLGFK